MQVYRRSLEPLRESRRNTGYAAKHVSSLSQGIEMGNNLEKSEGDGNEDGTGPAAPQVHCRDISVYQLSLFDGTDGKAALVALNGQVFDVTEDLSNEKHKDRIGKNVGVDESEVEAYRVNPKCKVVGNIVETKEFTEAELAKFIGEATDENPKAKIYLSAKGFVFDVSTGKSFYGPEGGYHKFAGKNCQRALALTSLNDDDVANTSIDDLEEKDLKTLDDWVKKYMEKYSHMGSLKR